MLLFWESRHLLRICTPKRPEETYRPIDARGRRDFSSEEENARKNTFLSLRWILSQFDFQDLIVNS